MQVMRRDMREVCESCFGATLEFLEHPCAKSTRSRSEQNTLPDTITGLTPSQQRNTENRSWVRQPLLSQCFVPLQKNRHIVAQYSCMKEVEAQAQSSVRKLLAADLQHEAANLR